jgi:alpha-glucuronidase
MLVLMAQFLLWQMQCCNNKLILTWHMIIYCQKFYKKGKIFINSMYADTYIENERKTNYHIKDKSAIPHLEALEY